MRVCIAQNVTLTDHLALSNRLRNIVQNLAKQKDIHLTLIILAGSRIPKNISKLVEIHEIEAELYSLGGNLKYSIGLYKKLRDLSQANFFDLIHCIYPNSSVLGAALIKRVSPETKILYDIRSPWIEMSIERGSIPKMFGNVYLSSVYSIESHLSRYVDGYIFITQGLEKFYRYKISLGIKPSFIVPSGVDFNVFERKESSLIRDKYDLKESDFLFGYVGGISEMRELDFVLRAFKILIKQNSRYKLMFVGDGEDRVRLGRLSKEFGIEKNVIFTGNVSYEEVPYYISSFDVGVCHLPDKLIFRHSFPLKILEYLACDKPVLASDIKAHRAIARKNSNILRYNSLNDFISKAKCMLKNPLKKNNKEIINFSWSNIAKMIHKIYMQIIERT